MGRHRRKSPPKRPKSDADRAQAESRVNSLINAIARDEYTLGDRPFPSPVREDDAVAVAAALQDELDGGAALRTETAAAQDIHIACERGCTGCCEEMVLVYRSEAVAIARWLEEADNASILSWFRESFARWRAAVGDAPERLADIRLNDRAEYDHAHQMQWRRRVLCAFNRDGDCVIYPVRPLVCRNAHAIDSSARCYGDDPSLIPATRLTFAPVDEFAARASYLLHALHNATSPPAERHRAQSVCTLVAGLIDEKKS